MTISVRMFAFARQCAGRDVYEVELPEGATVGQLRERLFVALPELGRLGAGVLFAVDTDYANDATRLTPGAEVACIPPVSGG